MCRRIKYLRDSHGYTQKCVADYLSISQAAYSRMEKGEVEMTLTKLMALSDLYRIALAKMLDGV